MPTKARPFASFETRAKEAQTAHVRKRSKEAENADIPANSEKAAERTSHRMLFPFTKRNAEAWAAKPRARAEMSE